MVEPDDYEDLFQPRWFCDFMILWIAQSSVSSATSDAWDESYTGCPKPSPIQTEHYFFATKAQISQKLRLKIELL